jgi:hypothetical protein
MWLSPISMSRRLSERGSKRRATPLAGPRWSGSRHRVQPADVLASGEDRRRCEAHLFLTERRTAAENVGVAGEADGELGHGVTPKRRGPMPCPVHCSKRSTFCLDSSLPPTGGRGGGQSPFLQGKGLGMGGLVSSSRSGEPASRPTVLRSPHIHGRPRMPGCRSMTA